MLSCQPSSVCHPHHSFLRTSSYNEQIFTSIKSINVSESNAIKRHRNLYAHTIGTQAPQVQGFIETIIAENPTVEKHYGNGQLQAISEFNRILASLVLADEFELASKLNSGLSSSGFVPDNLTYSIFINFCCKKDEPTVGKTVLDHMLAKGFEPDVVTFTTLINSFCENGRLEHAYRVFDVMSSIGCDPTINTFNCLLKGLCYVGRVEEACDLMANIKRTSLKPDIYTYTTVMDGLCKVGRCSEALELLNEAIEGELTPNVITYNTLFNGYFKEGKPMRGFGLLKKMKEKNCKPDHITYSTFLHGLLKWGKIKPALSIYTEMVRNDYQVDDRMSNTLLRGLCRRSRKEKNLLEDVYSLLEDMRNRDCAIYHDSYDLVIEALCTTRETKKILEALNETIEKDNSPKTFTFNLVIHTLCIVGEIDAALRVLMMMHNHRKPRGIPFGALIHELKIRGRCLDACNVYGVALKRGVVPKQKPKKYTSEKQE